MGVLQSFMQAPFPPRSRDFQSMRIRPLLLVPLVCLMAQAGPSARAQTQATPPSRVPDAREQVPAGLIGIWKLDTGASSAAAAGKNVIQLRSFQYSEDGRLLVNFIMVGEDARQMFGHWELQVDGSSGYEFRSDNGSTPIAEIRFKKVDAHTFDLSNLVAGELQSTALYKLSDDEKTLTMTRSNKKGEKTTYIYRRWDGR